MLCLFHHITLWWSWYIIFNFLDVTGDTFTHVCVHGDSTDPLWYKCFGHWQKEGGFVYCPVPPFNFWRAQNFHCNKTLASANVFNLMLLKWSYHHHLWVLHTQICGPAARTHVPLKCHWLLIKSWLILLSSMRKLLCQVQGFHLDLHPCCCYLPIDTAGRL